MPAAVLACLAHRLVEQDGIQRDLRDLAAVLAEARCEDQHGAAARGEISRFDQFLEAVKKIIRAP